MPRLHPIILLLHAMVHALMLVRATSADQHKHFSVIGASIGTIRKMELHNQFIVHRTVCANMTQGPETWGYASAFIC